MGNRIDGSISRRPSRPEQPDAPVEAFKSNGANAGNGLRESRQIDLTTPNAWKRNESAQSDVSTKRLKVVSAALLSEYARRGGTDLLVKEILEEIDVMNPEAMSTYIVPTLGPAPSVFQDDGRPVIVFDRFEYEHLFSNQRLCARLRELLIWAEPMIPEKLRVIEIRSENTNEFLIPSLFPRGSAAFEAIVEIVVVHRGRSAIGHSITAERGLVCGGSFEEVMYPCHDLLRDGVKEVGFVPQLCGPSTRSGHLFKRNVCSHLEEVLSVRTFPSVHCGMQWLMPDGPEFPSESHLFCDMGVEIVVHSQDDTKLNEEQQAILFLLFEDDVTRLALTKLGKGFSAALKFFCIPTISRLGTESAGALSFIKMGDEEEIHDEFLVTNHMMMLLGVHCPQILGYSEMGDTAAIHLSLVSLHHTPPRGFADLYVELVSPESGILGTDQGRLLAQRIQSAIDFVFTQLLTKLHAAKAEIYTTFSVADELGFCKDLGGREGTEEDSHMSSGWILEKLWRKKPGDGGLASSVFIHIALTLGDAEAKQTLLSFLPGHPCQRPNLFFLLSDGRFLTMLRCKTTFEVRQCLVHGDLHGDNIMIDGNDNRFLIDFGKTSLGHPLEDILWLEAFVLLSYTSYDNDAELADCLNMLPALAPPAGLTLESFSDSAMEAALSKAPVNARIKAMWVVVKSLRKYLGLTIEGVMESSFGDSLAEQRRCCMIAELLCLRNALFFLGARENKEAPRRRRLALAMACAYAEALATLFQYKIKYVAL